MDNKAGIKRTGEMMLGGWRLLADHCPICTFPLMSKKDELRCPNCDMAVMTEEDAAEGNFRYAEESKPAVTPQQSGLAIADSQRLYDEPDLPDSLEEMKKEYDLKNSRMNKVSAKLGEKMMAGWTLLGSICPMNSCNGTPLMKSKGDASMLCVCCEKWYADNGNGIVPKEIPPIAEVSSTAEPLAAPTSNYKKTDSVIFSRTKPAAVEPATSFQSLDLNDAPFLPDISASYVMDASEKIAKLLLRGWTMLDKVCDGACGGSVPLMRDSNGKVSSRRIN